MRRLAVTTIAMAMFSTIAMADTPHQFALLCTGQQVMRLGDLDQTPTPWTKIVRVDLDRGVWCDERCNAPAAIVEATPTSITLSEFHDSFGFRSTLGLNRVTGTVYKTGLDPIKITLETDKADCKPIPYETIPSTKF